MYCVGDKHDWQWRRLLDAWGPAEPMISDVRKKTNFEIEGWIDSLKRKVVMTTGRENGDGFWEARTRWYSARREWLENHWEGFEKTLPVKKRCREEALPPAPMKIARMMEATSPRDLVTVGGWPSADHQYTHGPTPSGLPTGESEDTSSNPVSPSHIPAKPSAGLDKCD